MSRVLLSCSLVFALFGCGVPVEGDEVGEPEDGLIIDTNEEDGIDDGIIEPEFAADEVTTIGEAVEPEEPDQVLLPESSVSTLAAAPRDAGVAPRDAGVAPRDVGVASRDAGVAPASGPLQGEFYGNPLAGDHVGHTGRYAEAAFRFRAERTAPVRSVTVHNRVVYRRPSDPTYRQKAIDCGLNPDRSPVSAFDACVRSQSIYAMYSYLDGGKVRVELRTVDARGVPTRTVLARATRDFVPEREGQHLTLSFDRQPVLQANTQYAVVYLQVGTSGGSVVLNGTFIRNPGASLEAVSGPHYRADFTTLWKDRAGGPWMQRTSVFPMFELTNSDGIVWGPGLSGHSGSKTRPVGGAAKVRQQLTPTTTIRTRALWVRLSRERGSSPLTITVRAATGRSLMSFAVPASRFVVGTPSTTTVPWVRIALPAQLTLPAGQRATLEYSAPNGTTYAASGTQSMSAYATRDAFRDGFAESTNGSTWSNGWQICNHYGGACSNSPNVDLSFLFERD